MKTFDRPRRLRTMSLAVVLLCIIGIAFYPPIFSFISAAAARLVPSPASAALLPVAVMTVAALIALAVIAAGAAALLRRETLMRRRAEAALGRFRLAADTATDLITVLSISGRIEYVNAAVERATGLRRDELLGRRAMPWYGDEKVMRRMLRTVREGGEFAERVQGLTRDHAALVLQEHVASFCDAGGRPRCLISTARDVTRELGLEDRVEYLDRFDPLTGLPNRSSLVALLDQTVTTARAAGAFVSVLIFDIDRFKYINGLYGVTAGDQLLKQAAERIRSAVAPGDAVARTGNDEFTVVHVDARKPVLAAAVAQQVRKVLTRPFEADGQDIAPTVSIGIAVHPDDGDDGWALLRNADLALERAKAEGRNAIQFYDSGIASRVKEVFALERRLYAALANNEYHLYYQPYCDLRSRKVSGAEALIRWKNPDLGTVSPDRFIPCLEDTGKVIDVGRWILGTACGQGKEWERRNRHFPVSVNLSLLQFRHQHLVGMVKDAIDASRIDPQRLTLEVTESAFMHDMDFAIRTMKRLKDLGVSLSVDDFGTGYSSLSYIKRLPVDNLKIDISFVRDVTTDQDAASIISAITTLAQNLKLKTIAEGVETEEQRNILHLLRCDMGQGYLFSPAVDARDFDRLLAG